MSKMSKWLKSLYEQPRLNDLSNLPDDILLYVPNLLRFGGLLFFVLSVAASVPYLIEYQHDTNLVLTRLVMIGYSVLSLTLTFIYVGKYYKACVIYQSLAGITFIFATGTHMMGFNINPHVLLVITYILSAAFTIGRQGVVITSIWTVLNYFAFQAISTWNIWPQPVTLSAESVKHENGSALFFLLVIMLPLLLGYSTLIRRSLRQLKQLYAKQHEHDRQLLLELSAERSRIGRDLHDGPLKENVFMQQTIDFCDSFIQTGDLEAAQAELQRLSDIVSHQADAIRALTGRLRPLELNAHGLAGAIQLLPVKLDRKLDIKIKNGLTEELKPELEGVIYYIIREALINASLHANPRCVRVALGRRDHTIYGEVSDDGDGFDIVEAKQRAESSGHHGLSSMQERLDLIGGSIRIESALGRGTTVAFTIPISPADIERAGQPVNQENSSDHTVTSQFVPNLQST